MLAIRLRRRWIRSLRRPRPRCRRIRLDLTMRISIFVTAGRITRSGSSHENNKNIEPRMNADLRKPAFIRGLNSFLWLKQVGRVIGDAQFAWRRSNLIDLLGLRLFALWAD